MDLSSYVENIRRDLAIAADAGGEDARALAERLTAPLESAVRLMLLDALSAAADEITRELAPGSVELRLRAGEPEFVVTAVPADEPVEQAAAAPPPPATPDADDGATARINLRLPEQLKAGVERAAGGERMSVNAWLVRVVAGALAPATPSSVRRSEAPASARATPAGCAERPLPISAPSASQPEPQEATPCPHSTPPRRSRPRSTSPSATSGSPPATARPPSWRSSRATRPTSTTSRSPTGPASSTRTGGCWSRRPSCAPGRPGRDGGSVDVMIELPAGSRVQGAGQFADFHADGRLGECRIKTGVGRHPARRGRGAEPKTGIGDITVERATGHAEITAASGDVRVRELGASAVIRSSNGDTWVGVAGGDLRIKAANGSIAVDVARGTVAAKAANGDVRLGDIERDAVVLETRVGDLEVGIREGTAAWLDVRASAGRVHNALEAADAPDASARTVKVRARTSAGNVVIRRA